MADYAGVFVDACLPDERTYGTAVILVLSFLAGI
jgi:hypothetical protein